MANEEIKLKNIELALQAAYEQFLIHGIEATTKSMIAKASGLSRPSVDRYFSSKTACVLQTARYIGESVRIRNSFPDSLFTEGKYSGKELLTMYMERAKELYAKTPRLFILRNEYKQYVYRHCSSFDQGYNYLLEALESRQLVRKIFVLGVRDGSFPDRIDTEIETEYFCESFLGFLGNVALIDTITHEEMLAKIVRFIERTKKWYEK